MDCKLKTWSQVWLIALFIPTLLMGYGKSVIRIAQNEDDSTVGVEHKGNAGKHKVGTGRKKASKQISDHSGKSETNSSTKLNLNTSVPVQSSQPVADNIAEDSSGKKSDKGKSAEESPVTELDEPGNSGIVEPDLTNGTYNQVRAKKPSIPSRFDGNEVYNARNDNRDDLSRVSVVGLLGIPTVVFGVLFFVMWGIISGRIQRIMF